MTLGLETGDASLVRDRITARQVRAFLGAPGADPTDGLERLREQLDAPALPPAVQARGRQVLERLSAWASTDPEHARAREYLQCLVSLPWTRRTAAVVPLDLARVRAILDAGHAAHGRGEGAPARLRRRAPGKAGRPVPVALSGRSAPGSGRRRCRGLSPRRSGGRARGCLRGCWRARRHCTAPGQVSPGRIVEELRRVGVRNPVFVLDEIDCLDEAGGAAAALLEALDPAPGAAFRDHYLDLPFDLSEALFRGHRGQSRSVPSKLRERMAVIELSGYTEAEKRVIATGHLLPLQLAFHGLTAGQVRITDEAVEAVIRGYTREAGVWDLAGILGALCAKVVRRRAEGHGRHEHQGNEEEHAESEEEHGKEGGEHGKHDEHQGNEAPVEVTPETVVEMLGAPAHSR